MESMEQILKHFSFTDTDQGNLKKIAGVLLPFKKQFANDFYEYLQFFPDTAKYFTTKEAVAHRKQTFATWFDDLLTANYDNRYLLRLQRIGKVHVDIGLQSYLVNAAMNFIRELCRKQIYAQVRDVAGQEDLLDTMHKVIDINLSIMTSSYQEEKIKKVFLSQRVESHLILWAERLLHGLNLVLLAGLLAMGVGVVILLATDIYTAFSGKFDYGVIKALGSLLILWMMIELLHTEIDHLRGGKFQVRIFVELAIVAFIRKLFVASFEYKDATSFALLQAGLLVLGVVYFFVTRKDKND